METLQTGFCFSYINIQLWIQLATEMIARRRSNSRSHEERINCPAKQLRLTWHVVCLLSAELPAQTFQFPFPLARLGNERPWQARGSCGVHTFLSLPSFPHTKKHGELDPCIFFSAATFIKRNVCFQSERPAATMESDAVSLVGRISFSYSLCFFTFRAVDTHTGKLLLGS